MTEGKRRGPVSEEFDLPHLVTLVVELAKQPYRLVRQFVVPLHLKIRGHQFVPYPTILPEISNGS
jgi:hypothetical protein